MLSMYVYVQIVAKQMIARGKGGSIVFVSSTASARALDEHLLYCSTKGALDQMMRVFALELGKHQVGSVSLTFLRYDYFGLFFWL